MGNPTLTILMRPESARTQQPPTTTRQGKPTAISEAADNLIPLSANGERTAEPATPPRPPEFYDMKRLPPAAPSALGDYTLMLPFL